MGFGWDSDGISMGFLFWMSIEISMGLLVAMDIDGILGWTWTDRWDIPMTM